MARPFPFSQSLLLTLDAYGTLFRPRSSIASQYLETARSCGLSISVGPDEFSSYFKRAFKAQNARFPNYGKTSGMAPELWWNQIISDSFKPLLQPNEILPPNMSSRLFEHFSGPAYELFPDTHDFFRQMKGWKTALNSLGDGRQLVVGVLSNSDPRVTRILRELGLIVGDGTGESVSDVDFVLTSYEIGYEKPHPMAFSAAEEAAQLIFETPIGRYHSRVVSDREFARVHIGDDLEKDYGAAKYGKDWHAFWLNRDMNHGSIASDVRLLSNLGATPAGLSSLVP